MFSSIRNPATNATNATNEPKNNFYADTEVLGE